MTAQGEADFESRNFAADRQLLADTIGLWS
jgi:hypothetical protein